MRYWRFADRPATATATTEAVPVGVDNDTFKAELKHAYDRGRDEARARRPRFGLLGVILALAALCGAGAIGLAIQQGSFTGAGQVIDGTLAQAGGRVAAATTAAQQAAPASGAPQQH